MKKNYEDLRISNTIYSHLLEEKKKELKPYLLMHSYCHHIPFKNYEKSWNLTLLVDWVGMYMVGPDQMVPNMVKEIIKVYNEMKKPNTKV